MDTFIQVVTMVETREEAGRMARVLVESRLAACVQVIGPVASTYRWKGRIEEAAEWQCVLKTRQGLYEALEQAIREIHPYEVPEIIALPILRGSPSYLEWLRSELA